MTQEDKQLLLKDLCARLPYRCMIECSVSEDAKMDIILFPEHIIELIEGNLIVKPYLRPMSSITEEEVKEFQAFHCIDGLHPYFYQEMCNLQNLENMMGWLNANHFDYRGLIEKGLALEAPNEMYKNK